MTMTITRTKMTNNIYLSYAQLLTYANQLLGAGVAYLRKVTGRCFLRLLDGRKFIFHYNEMNMLTHIYFANTCYTRM